MSPDGCVARTDQSLGGRVLERLFWSCVGGLGVASRRGLIAGNSLAPPACSRFPAFAPRSQDGSVARTEGRISRRDGSVAGRMRLRVARTDQSPCNTGVGTGCECNGGMTEESGNSPTLREIADPFSDKMSISGGRTGSNDNHPYRQHARARPRSRQRLKRIARATRQLASMTELAYMELRTEPWQRRSFELRYVLSVAAFASAFGALVGVGGTYLFYRPPRPTRAVQTRPAHRVLPRVTATRGAAARAAPPTATARAASHPPFTTSAAERSNWTLPRSLAAQLYEDLIAGRSPIGLVPHEAAGQTVGLKIYGVRRDSHYAALGFENGDLLMAVNGLPFSHPDRLRWDVADQNVFAVLLERHGQPRVQVYTVDP